MSRSKRMHQLPAADRPREKLQKKGVIALSDFELLQVILGSGNGTSDVSSIARQIQRLMRKGLHAVHYESLTAIKGVSTATAGRILAGLELSKRQLIWESEPIQTIQDILARLGDIRNKQQEYLLCVSLDGGNRMIALRTITIGTLDSLLAHPREVFADAISDRAASIIIAHNHPSGEPQPSQKDISLTQQLAGAGQLLGITLRDHVIVTKNNYFSFRQHHLL